MSCERQVIVLISSGQNLPPLGTSDYFALLERTRRFKQSGGIIICVGLRASGDGYTLLQQLATGGYFINVFGDGTAPVENAVGSLIGLMGYFCAATVPPYGYGCSQYGYNCLDAPPGEQAPEIAPDQSLMPYPGGIASNYAGNSFSNTWYIPTGILYFLPPSDSPHAWVQYQFPVPVQVSSYLLQCLLDGHDLTFSLQASNDGINWVVIDSKVLPAGWPSTKRVKLAAPATYPFWRLVLEDGVKYDAVLGLVQWSLYR